MHLNLKAAVRAAIVLTGVVFLIASSVNAATIIKLSLGGDPSPDVQFNGLTFSTVDDGVAATTGQQNTAVDFLAFLSAHHPNITTSTASYTLTGLTPVGPAGNIGVVTQAFVGGSFQLYDVAPGNALLLSGNLGGSELIGTNGPPSTGAVFSTTFATVTGGSLAPFILPNSLNLSISMTAVTTAGGIPGLQSPGGVLQPFAAAVTQTIAGDAPEPSSVLMAMLGGVFLSAYSLRRKK
jgi:PEP-CTERM motif-containing protein